MNINRNSTFVYLLATIKRLLLTPIAKLKFGNKQVWLVCERGTDARDNGYHMFCYLRREHPEINAWYVITRDSVDLKNIIDLGNVVYRASVKHWMLYSCAIRVFTAFEPQFVPSGNKHFAQDVIKKNNQKIIFLQHGIIETDLPLYYRENAKFDMFICGAEPEFNYVSSHYHYLPEEVKYTGLARFDALHNINVKRQILIMPTWRRWLAVKNEYEVAQSEYVERWNHLLENPKLLEIVEKYNIKVIFYPHQLMQKYVGLFHSQNSNIIIGDYKTYDVQSLLKESALLITDYSSIHFDFAYMKKPLLYYQFDEERVYKEHCIQGYFDFQKMGFGEKEKNEDKLLNFLEDYISNGFHLKTEFEKRVEQFFPLYDTCNCERIYQEVVKRFG